MKLDGQGRVTIPQRLRESVGIKKEVVVLGVRERMEIWDRGEFERYRDAHAAAYENGDLEPRGIATPRDLTDDHSLNDGTRNEARDGNGENAPGTTAGKTGRGRRKEL